MNLRTKCERELPDLKSAMQNFNLVMENRPTTPHAYFQSTCRLHLRDVMRQFIFYYGAMYLPRKQNKEKVDTKYAPGFKKLAMCKTPKTVDFGCDFNL